MLAEIPKTTIAKRENINLVISIEVSIRRANISDLCFSPYGQPSLYKSSRQERSPVGHLQRGHHLSAVHVRAQVHGAIGREEREEGEVRLDKFLFLAVDRVSRSYFRPLT